MPVSFDRLQVGELYTRPDLATLWGYRGYEAISRGAVTPSGTKYIILFITREKQSAFTQYDDDLQENLLSIQGETNHAVDERLVAAEADGDEVHLFYRAKHHQPFEYKGQVYLLSYEIHSDQPSRFRFALDSALLAAAHDLETETQTHGTEVETFVADEEGRKAVQKHIKYERSLRNRTRAIQLHGTTCLACGFDFNASYGHDHAGNYIEVHHVRSIAAGIVTPDPANDLIPLCSNCHSMAHRRRDMCLDLAAIKALLRLTPA